jgi:hypothetical protein
MHEQIGYTQKSSARTFIDDYNFSRTIVSQPSNVTLLLPVNVQNFVIVDHGLTAIAKNWIIMCCHLMQRVTRRIFLLRDLLACFAGARIV